MSIASRINEMTEHLRNDWDSINKLGLDITEENSNDNLDKNIENIAPVLGKFYNQVSDKTDLAKNGIVGRTSQDGEPTPENPVEVNNLSGDVEYRVKGKNLFDKDSEDVGHVYSSTGSYGISGLWNTSDWIKASDYITISASTTGSMNILLSEFDNSKTFIQRTHQPGTSKTYNLNTNTKYVRLSYKNDIGIANIQLELGSTATSYEPYIEPQTFNIPLGDIELCNISDYKDRIYSQNGEFYLEKKTDKVVFDGSESWQKINNAFQTGAGNTPNKGSVLLDAYSNYFIHKYYASAITSNIQNGEFGWNSGKNLTIRNDSCSTANDFKTWLSTHNTVVYYVLATPTTTEITEENYPTLYSQLLAIQEFLTKYKINKEFLLDYSSPEIEY